MNENTDNPLDLLKEIRDANGARAILQYAVGIEGIPDGWRVYFGNSDEDLAFDPDPAVAIRRAYRKWIVDCLHE